MSAYQQPTLTKLESLPAIVKRVLLVNDELLAVRLRRELFPDTAVVHADVEQLGHPLYRDEIIKRCGEGLMVYAPLDLYPIYRGDSLAGLGSLGARLTSIPMTVADIEKNPAGLQTVLEAKDKVVEADDAEANRLIIEQTEEDRKQAALQSSVKGLSGSQAPSNAPAERETADTPLNCQDVVSLAAKAKEVIECADPIELVKEGIKTMGYGGKIETAVIIYLAFTSRLLAMRRGSMPVHLLVKGQASGGKSYAVKIVTSLLPRSAVFEIDASSPRVLIYTEAEFKHKVTIFSEADSLPAGEDNPAASAIRNLLQDHRLKYEVVEAKGNRQQVRKISKEGPTVLVTTATRSLGHQLMTRLFVLDIPDDQNQIRAALNAQASLELHGSMEPGEELIAFQELLQYQAQYEAPFNVLVPFADKLAEAIGRRPQAARINRDYARLLSLIKAVAVLRKYHRQRNGSGQIVAELEDYKTVHELVSDMFESSVTGASKAVCETVKEVTGLIGGGSPETITVSQVADALKINKESARRRIHTAINGGWLVNHEDRPRRPFKLTIGDPLPEGAGLPTPEELTTLATADNSLTTSECCDLQDRLLDNVETGSMREKQGEPAPELTDLREQGRLAI
ncbi:MAG: hypothetical protein M1455_08105 [Actinobacteria bacterium]|nr:hypothetical protein [Actinomycetota bacterium]